MKNRALYFLRNKLKVLILLGVVLLGILGILVLTAIFGAFEDTKNEIFQYSEQRMWSLLIPAAPKADANAIAKRFSDDAAYIVNSTVFQLHYPIFDIARAAIILYGVTERDLSFLKERIKIRLVAGKWFEEGTNQIVTPQAFLNARKLSIGQQIRIKDQVFIISGVIEGDYWFILGSKGYLEGIDNSGELLLAFPKNNKIFNDQLEKVKQESLSQLRVVTPAQIGERLKETNREYNLIYIGFSIFFAVVIAGSISFLVLLFYRTRMIEFAIKYLFGFTKKRILADILMEQALLLSVAWLLSVGISYGVLSLLIRYFFYPNGIILQIKFRSILGTILVVIFVFGLLAVSIWKKLYRSNLLDTILGKD